jgi:hypothetical protein
MRSRAEITVELVKVRAILAKLRSDDGEDSTDMMYGAQQALAWLVEKAMSPSDLHDVISDLAEELEQDE